MPATSEIPSAKRISPVDQHCFFGYYDVSAVAPGGFRHLVHRVEFIDRLPTAREPASVGWIDLRKPESFVAIGTTHAWNFQQGAGLQWLGDGSERVFYNDVRPDGSGYRGVIVELDAGHETYTDRALASLSRDAQWGLAVNFDRLYEFRPGYGYALNADPYRDVERPADDGIWLCDLSTGCSELVLSLAAIHREIALHSPALPGKILVNHISFSPSGARFVALARNFPPLDAPERPGGRWLTCAFIANRDGTGVRVIVPPGYASHYNWRDDDHLVFHCDGPTGTQLYEVAIALDPVFRVVDSQFFTWDGHCAYSPDRQTLLYDSYPDSENLQHLYAYELASGRASKLGSFRSIRRAIDARCDLHARWIGPRKVSFDSTHEGFRGVYVVHS